MSIASISKMQISCMQTGKMNYSSLPRKVSPSLEATITKFHRTIGTDQNAVPRQILTNSPHVYWMYVDTQGMIQVTHSLVPFDDSTALCYLGAHGDGILDTLCKKFPMTAFGACVLTVIPLDKIGFTRSWGTTSNDCLPDSFVSATS